MIYLLQGVLILLVGGCGIWLDKDTAKNSIFSEYSDSLCSIDFKDGTQNTMKCGQLQSRLLANSTHCQTENPPSKARFPNSKEALKLCQPSFFNDLSKKESIRFLVFGDSGKGQNDEKGYGQVKVAKAMSAVCKSTVEESCHFAILTGDFIYPEGLSSVWDNKAHLLFENIYNVITPGFPIYLVAGNHDHLGSIVANIWRYPALHYKIDKLPKWLNIYALDTTKISEDGTQQNLHQLEAIKSKLCESNGWKFAFGHHPPDAGGHHNENEEIIEFLTQLNTECPLDGFFGEHEHHQEHLRHSGFDVFVQGGGGTRVRKVDIKPNFNRHRYAIAAHGFAMVEVTESEVDVYYYDANKWEYRDNKFKRQVDFREWVYHCKMVKGKTDGCIP